MREVKEEFPEIRSNRSESFGNRIDAIKNEGGQHIGKSRYVLIFEGVDGSYGRFPAPTIVRVRQLLKIALRALGLRCVEVREEVQS